MHRVAIFVPGLLAGIAMDARERSLRSVHKAALGLPTRERVTMVNDHDAWQAAAEFARALDQDDFDAARAVLADDCVYVFGGETLVGADAVLAPYRDNAAKAVALFECVVYESNLELIDARTVQVHFLDRLEVHGRRHVFRCRQILTVGGDGTIVRIEHRELKAERAALERFIADATRR